MGAKPRSAVFLLGPAPSAQWGVWPCATARAKGCVASAQGAKALVGALQKEGGASMIKPLQPGFARGKTGQPSFGRGKAAPFGGFATTFPPVGSVSLDSQSPKGSLRIQFPCHPASGGTIKLREVVFS